VASLLGRSSIFRKKKKGYGDTLTFIAALKATASSKQRNHHHHQDQENKSALLHPKPRNLARPEHYASASALSAFSRGRVARSRPGAGVGVVLD